MDDEIPPVWAAGQRWAIQFHDDIMADGFCIPEQSEIQLNGKFRDADPSYIRKLVMHELMHAIDHTAGVFKEAKVYPGDPDSGVIEWRQMPDGSVGKVKPFCLSEHAVNVFSEGLWITFSDPRNAPFMRWLLHDVWAEAWSLFSHEERSDDRE